MPVTEMLTILFADIAGSTHLYEDLGNTAAKAIMDVGLGAMSREVRAGGGEVVKTMGDEVLCTFPSAEQAARAAPGLHRALAETSTARSLVAYVGFHRGEVITEDGDVFGDAVNVAARVVKLQRPRQTLTTGITLAELSLEFRESARLIDEVSLKGKREPFEIYELVWEAAELTFVQTSGAEARVPEAHLELTLGGDVHHVGMEQTEISLGRLGHNDIVVDSTCTSRTHARIERRGRAFVLVDQSSNGTYVHPEGREPRHLLREEAPLMGTGSIGLGARIEDQKVEPIHYRVFLSLSEECDRSR